MLIPLLIASNKSYDEGKILGLMEKLLQYKSGCSENVKTSISSKEIIAAIRKIEEKKHRDQMKYQHLFC